MGQPITVTDGVCFAFPDVLMTPVPGSSPVPIPYPNIAQLSDAKKTSPDVTAGGKEVVIVTSEIENSSGGEAGTDGAASGGAQNAACTFVSGSGTVTVNGEQVVRLGDPTEQNDGNAVGTVLGGLPTVLVGG